MKTRVLVLSALTLLSVWTVRAQEATASGSSEQQGLDFTISADLVNQYLWRGLDLGSVSFQPTLGVAYKGLSLSAWGSVGIANASDNKEIDLTLAYTLGGLNVSVIDYWFNSGLDPDNRYFKYDAHGTNHVFEGNIGYDFGFASLQWYTNFAGNDGAGSSGKRAYSSYVEATVPFGLAGAQWEATAGAVPYATDYYETNGFAVTNLTLRATKDIRVTDAFSVPVFGQLTGNPCSGKAYLVVGFTLQP